MKKSIKLLGYDFDGVMTDNKVYVDQDGNEMVQVNSADGLGVSEIKKLGIKQMIFSTENPPVVSARVKKTRHQMFAEHK
jgi:3-deoxy-D-manno-octulosonate 8-phosphate phosphatase (KDO 8-P phosphatase)